MKISQKLTIVSALLLAAGCAHQERQAQYNESGPSATYGASSPSSSSSSGTASSSFGSKSAGTASEFGSQGGTDQALTTQVKQAINNDTTLAAIAPKIEVTAQNGTVTLAGSVPTDQDKQRIESMVRSTSGVVSVNNQLRVSVEPTSTALGQSSRLYQESTGQAGTIATEPSRTDSTADSPKSDLSSVDKSSSQTSTSQNTDSSLSPTTPTPNSGSQSDLSPTSQPGSPSRIYSASQTSTTGQAGDSLNLNVQGNTEADRTLGQKVMQELRTDAGFAGQISTIKISVENGKVALMGTVKSDDQKRSIEAAVQRVTGVSTVDDQLQVGASPIPTPTSDTDQNK